MKDLYFTIAGIVNGQICITEIKKIEPEAIDETSLDVIKRDGAVTFGDEKFSMITVVGTYGVIATLREFFVFGLAAAGTPIESQKEWFREYCIRKYDNTIDILDEKGEDIATYTFPYTIGPAR